MNGSAEEVVIETSKHDGKREVRGGFVGSGRSARKHGAIMEAAREVFLREGFDRASMDEVAAIAAVSKQTVYKHFVDKTQLFGVVVSGDTGTTYSRTQAMVAELHASNDLERDLRRFAREHINDITQPRLIQLRRVVIAEAERFPDLARAYYANGPGRFHAALAEQLDALAKRGLLRVEDPQLAAQHLNWLILSVPINQAMFLGSEARPAPAELERYADEAVRVFLAAYGPVEIPRSAPTSQATPRPEETE